MRAVVFAEHGPPDVLRVVELERPKVSAEKVLVRVRAGGMQPFDTRVRQGWPGLALTLPSGIGNEFAGTVHEVGPGVDGFTVGDDVLGWTYLNAIAEYLLVDADAIAPKPPGMPWEVAGALSASGQTAHTALTTLGVHPGDTVLIHAAAGGVGTVAVQLAKAWGAVVIGTASEPNHDYLADLGAIPVSYGEGLVERVRAVAPHGVDAVLDGAGGQALLDSVGLVRAVDRIVTLVDFELADKVGARRLQPDRSVRRLNELVDLHSAGRLRIHVRASFDLDQVARAHHEVEHGHGRGKVVVTIP